MACAALGLLMIPAVGLFYGGMVRRKNVLSAFQQSFVLLGVVPVQWVSSATACRSGPTSSRAFAAAGSGSGCKGWDWSQTPTSPLGSRISSS